MSRKPTAEDLPKDIAMPPLPPETAEASEPESGIEEVVLSASATVETEEVLAEPTVDKVATVEAKQPTEVESAKERNFKALREKAEKAERERDELIRRLQESENIQSRKQANAPSIPDLPEDTDFIINPDDLAEGKHLVKLQKQIKQMQADMQHYKQQASVMTTEQRIKSEMPDYEKVVNDENIALLKTMEPELADSIGSNPDFYSKAKAVYRAMKRLGIHNDDTFQHEKALVQKNAAKPRPLTSVSPQQGDTPLSRANAFANGLTDDLKEQLLKEMYEARKSVY